MIADINERLKRIEAQVEAGGVGRGAAKGHHDEASRLLDRAERALHGRLDSDELTIAEVVQANRSAVERFETHERAINAHERAIAEMTEGHRAAIARLDKQEKAFIEMTQGHRAAIARLDKQEKAIIEMTEGHRAAIARLDKQERSIARLERISVALVESGREESKRVRALKDGVSTVLAAQSHLDDVHQAMVRSHETLVREQQKLAQALQVLSRSQAATDRRFRDFVALVARQVVSGNGKKGRPDRPRSS